MEREQPFFKFFADNEKQEMEIGVFMQANAYFTFHCRWKIKSGFLHSVFNLSTDNEKNSKWMPIIHVLLFTGNE